MHDSDSILLNNIIIYAIFCFDFYNNIRVPPRLTALPQNLPSWGWKRNKDSDPLS